MNDFMDYPGYDMPEVFMTLATMYENDNDNFSWGTETSGNENLFYDTSSPKKWLLEEPPMQIDGSRWAEKPVQEWCQEETAHWLMSIAAYIGQPYSCIQQSLVMPGSDLLCLSRENFMACDPLYGAQLYDLLHSQQISTISSISTNNHLQMEVPQQTSCPIISNVINNASDAESENSVEITRKRLPGRPRLLKPKKNTTTQGKLWEFIRDLLRNRETCPSLICWEDYSQAKFRFVRSDEVAKRWGSRKGNTKMNYEKLSRAMRYYYKSKIFLPVLGRRLVYQFGPNAKGWQTDNPNFRR